MAEAGAEFGKKPKCRIPHKNQSQRQPDNRPPKSRGFKKLRVGFPEGRPDSNFDFGHKKTFKKTTDTHGLTQIRYMLKTSVSICVQRWLK